MKSIWKKPIFSRKGGEPYESSTAQMRSFYRSPLAQVILVGMICFLCPGMFNALNGLGAGGQLNSSVTSNSLTGLYTTFAIFGFIAGSVFNLVGARATMAFGGLGYALYSASLLTYNHTGNSTFVIVSGSLLGVCAAFLWCAQGTVMMSYPSEGEKGKFIGLFWAIFNTGAVLGSISPIVQNWDNDSNGVVNDGTYVGFLILMCIGALLGCFLLPAHKITRKDGSKVSHIKHASIKQELFGLARTLYTDCYILLLFPMFWASNWFYTYQQNAFNLYLFNLRGRAFNNIWYWLAQIIGAVLFGNFLDQVRLGGRRQRAWIGWVVLFILVNGVWGAGVIVLQRYSNEREQIAHAAMNIERLQRGLEPDQTMPEPPMIDIYDSRFAGYCILYLMYGLIDAMWQTYVYWLMGALSNNPHKLAYFAGFYKSIQSAGAAVVWRLDATGTSFDILFGSSWGLCVLGLFCAIPVVYWKVTEFGEADGSEDYAIASSEKSVRNSTNSAEGKAPESISLEERTPSKEDLHV